MLLLASLLLACSASTPAEASPKTACALAWRRLPLGASGVSVEALAEATPFSWDEADGRVVAAKPGAKRGNLTLRSPDPAGPVATVRYGDGATLADWRLRQGAQRPGVVVGPETAATVCGHPAHRQEISEPGRIAEGGFPDAKGQLEYRQSETPAMTTVALAFEHRGVRFVVSWQVATKQRAKQACPERRFFASLACK